MSKPSHSDRAGQAVREFDDRMRDWIFNNRISLVTILTHLAHEDPFTNYHAALVEEVFTQFLVSLENRFLSTFADLRAVFLALSADMMQALAKEHPDTPTLPSKPDPTTPDVDSSTGGSED